jgi:uncharacterized protein
MSVVATIEELEAIYGSPGESSTVKVADRITPSYRLLVEKSPFATLATSGPEGLDCSPRGDLPGFIRIHDENTLMMPDRRGNNRIDSLRNIVRDPRVALLRVDPMTLPTPGQILAEMSENRVGGEQYDREWPERARQSMW